MARIVKRYILKAQVDKSKEAEITEGLYFIQKGAQDSLKIFICRPTY